MKKSDFAKKLPLIITVVVILFTIIFGFLINDFMKDKPKPKKIVRQVTTIILPPPPPPPEIEPDEIEPEIEEDIVEEIMDESMPEEMGESLENDLGLDADGSAGSDSFGLKARKGGRSFLGGGSVYATQIQTQINDLIAGHDELPFIYFEVVCKIWIDEKGKLENIELVHYSGDEEIRHTLKNLIISKLQVNNGPPLEMPQPIKLRLRNEF